MSEVLDIAGVRAAGREKTLHATIAVVVDNVVEKAARDGRQYVELHLCDALDRFVLRVWPDNAMIAEVTKMAKGTCLLLDGDFSVHPTFGLDVKKWEFRELTSEEREEFLAGPEELRERQRLDYEWIVAEVAGLKDPRLRALCEVFLDKWGMRFQRTAAARFFHHARRGGLVEHVAQMMRYAGAVCAVNHNLNRDLLIAGVLFHDCGKLWENSVEEAGFNMPFDERGELLGHITVGIELVNSLWKTLPLDDWAGLMPKSEDVRLHLLHLIASHHGELEYGSPVQPKTPEAVALHYVDNLDAKLEMLAKGYATTGLVSERIYDKIRPLNIRPVVPLTAFVSSKE